MASCSLIERDLNIRQPLSLWHDPMSGDRVQFVSDLFPAGLKCCTGSWIRGCGSDHELLLIDQAEANGGYGPGAKAARR